MPAEAHVTSRPMMLDGTVVLGDGGSVLTLPLLLVGFVRGGDEAVGAAVALVCIMPTLALFAVASRWIQEA